MRLALLGAGRIGRLHARLLSSTPGVERLVVADADPATIVKLIGERFGAAPKLARPTPQAAVSKRCA